MDLREILQTAQAAALAGGRVLRGRSGHMDQVNHKGPRDLVTELDLASQEAVLDTVAGAFPDHRALAEESSGVPDLAGPVWIVDPLDGTTNFVHGLPMYSVSVAFALGGELMAGAIYDPEREEMFAAARGAGAFLNGRPIAVAGAGRMVDALTVTGFPYEMDEARMSRMMRRMSNVIAASQGVRRLGSAALDLAYVACGRLDVFWEEGLKPWDMAAGVLICREAGGVVTDLDGGPYDLLSGRLLASNRALNPLMVSALGG